jgi:hypothetical protein
MMIIHENLPMEATSVAKALYNAYKIDSRIANHGMGNALTKIEGFDGYRPTPLGSDVVKKLAPSGDAFLITPKDMYFDDKSQKEGWVFGGDIGGVFMVSTARLKGQDNAPRTELDVPVEQYLGRLNLLSVHELGHSKVKAPHMKPAVYVSNEGYRLPLGPHCDDNSCAMYEVIDVKAPNDGFLELGGEKKFDAGVDDMLDRLYPDWLCERCRNSVVTSI